MLSLICQPTSEDIKHHFIIIIIPVLHLLPTKKKKRKKKVTCLKSSVTSRDIQTYGHDTVACLKGSGWAESTQQSIWKKSCIWFRRLWQGFNAIWIKTGEVYERMQRKGQGRGPSVTSLASGWQQVPRPRQPYNVSPNSDWQAVISQSAHADGRDTPHFRPPTAHNHLLLASEKINILGTIFCSELIYVLKSTGLVQYFAVN